MDEYLDIVNEKDVAIGRLLRSQVYEKGLSNFRVINMFIINSNGELWIPRRTANKRIFPLCLDMSVGGHVESGENYESALIREVSEELNIDLKLAPFKILGHLRPQDGVSAFMNVYELMMDEVPNYNIDDYVEYYWLEPKKVIEMIDGGEMAKSDLPKLIKKFYMERLR